MIKVDKNEVNIKGELLDTLAEFSCLTHAMKEMLSDACGSDGYAMLQHSFKMGLLEETQVKERINKTRKAVEVMKMINEAMKNEKKEDD